MKKLFYFSFFLFCLLVSSKQSYANVYASGLKISDDTCSTYAFAGSTWDGNFANGGLKIWFIINEAGGSAGSLSAVVRIKQGATVIRTLNVTSPQMGANNVLWDGNNDASAPVSAGNYSYEVYVSDAVGHTNFDSLWVAGANANGSKDFDGGTSFPYRGNASITDQTQANFGNIYVVRGTSSANGFYELRADGFYNQKIGTNPSWPAYTPTENFALGGKVYGLSGYGYTGAGFVKSFNSLTNTFADSIGFYTTNVRGLAIRVSGTDTLFYTTRSGSGLVPSIFVRKGVNGDTSMFVNMSSYILTGSAGYLKAVAVDDSGNVYVAYGNASASRKKLAKFNSGGVLVFADSLDGKYGLASTATFSSLAVYHGSDPNSNADDKLYALVYSGTTTQWGIYSFSMDGSSATQLVSPLGCSSAATSELINTDPAGNIVWSNGSTSERIIQYSPKDGPNSYTTQSPTSMSIVVPKNSLTGTYYVGAAGTAPGGTNPHFSSLSAATKLLDSVGVSGNITFYFTSSLTETVNSTIGLDPSPYTVTFKPYTGTVDTIKFTQTSDNVGASGGLVFGPPTLTVTSGTNYGLVHTANIVVDGSNSVGGSTRDLIFTTASNISANTVPLRLLGDVNNVTIKNCKVIPMHSVSYAVALVNRNGGTTYGNWTPDSITISNCEVVNTVSATGQGIAITNSGTPTTYPTAIVFGNNKITAKTRGIFLNYAGNTDVFNNEVNVIQTITGYMSYGIWGYTIMDSSNVLNIYNNSIKTLSTMNSSSGDYGIVGIEAGSKGIYNIYNNMISGFVDSTATANPNTKMIGIRLQTATVTANVYFNSILMPDVSITPGTGNVQYYGIYAANGNSNIKNNIVVTNEKDFPSYGIFRTGILGSLVTDYNDFFASDTAGNVGYWNSTARKSLANWKDSSAMDSHSLSVNPGFVSSSDLHLALNTSPVIGQGTAISTITKDIDGELRDTPPEMGADEKAGVVPVEITTFAAKVIDNKVSLSWSTATETNNSRFDIERKTANSDWVQIGNVPGNGTTAKVHNYSFVDSKINFDKASYRIKQIDFDGSYSYSKEVEINVSAPIKFELSQNYPNPFNPVTTISYSLPVSSHVRLEVYSITGQRVKLLVDETQTAGVYNRRFDGSSLASGIYIYRITAGEFVVSKKMQLIK